VALSCGQYEPDQASATNGWLFMGWNDGTTTNRYNIIIRRPTAPSPLNSPPAIRPTSPPASAARTLTLAWPADHLGWVLQALTNRLSYTNWSICPALRTNLVVISINPGHSIGVLPFAPAMSGTE